MSDQDEQKPVIESEIKKSITSPVFRVAIVGRPNVGKSTLFNRMIRKRRAITDPTPGVTRDPLEETIEIDGLSVKLVDTGGLSESKEYLDDLVTQRSLKASKAAHLILFVIDVEELTASDEEFIEQLRTLKQKIILVVNKVDNEARESQIYEYYSLGFSQVYGVSATHGYGVQDLMDAVTDTLVNLPDSSVGQYTKEDDDHEISVAVLGQPNTGKSTLINLLLGKDVSIVSDLAGTTRDVTHHQFNFKNKVFKVLDTAGIRRKKKVNEDLEYYSVNRAIRAIDEADVVFLLIDSEKGLVEQDKKITQQIVYRGKGVILVLNKWDLVEQTPNVLTAMKDRVKFLFPILDFAPILPLSGKTGEGLNPLLKRALLVHSQLNRRIDTGKLNRALKQWVERTPPPSGKKGRWKIRYVTQVSANPVKLMLFVNRSKGFPEFYVGYIKNQFRKEFQLDQIPISIELREGQRWEDRQRK